MVFKDFCYGIDNVFSWQTTGWIALLGVNSSCSCKPMKIPRFFHSKAGRKKVLSEHIYNVGHHINGSQAQEAKTIQATRIAKSHAEFLMNAEKRHEDVWEEKNSCTSVVPCQLPLHYVFPRNWTMFINIRQMLCCSAWGARWLWWMSLNVFGCQMRSDGYWMPIGSIIIDRLWMVTTYRGLQAGYFASNHTVKDIFIPRLFRF